MLLNDDQCQETGPADAPNVIIHPSGNGLMDAVTLKQASLAGADSLLSTNYLAHPLTQASFNRQAERLITQYGAAAFAGPPGYFPQRTLFMEGGQVVAEPPQSQRQRYGVYFERDKPPSEMEVEVRVRQWLEG